MTDFDDDDIEFAPDHDPVHSPSHYTKGGVECIDGIEAALGPVKASGFGQGNALKYVWRAGDKGDYIEDLQKAKWYLDREIEKSIKAREEPAPEKPSYVGHRCFFTNKIIAINGRCDSINEHVGRECRPLMASDGFCTPRELDTREPASVGSPDETESDRPHPRCDVGALPDARSEQLVRDSHQQLGFLS